MSEERSRFNSCGRSPSRSRSRGRSPSHSCSRSRIPIKSRSRSDSRSVDAYHIVGVDAGHDSPPPSTEHMSDREEAEKFQDLWIEEMSRPKPKTNHQGRVTGHGSWYERKPHTYSNAEFMASQGHNDRVRTVDCTPPDRDERKLGENDSL